MVLEWKALTPRAMLLLPVVLLFDASSMRRAIRLGTGNGDYEKYRELSLEDRSGQSSVRAGVAQVKYTDLGLGNNITRRP